MPFNPVASTISELQMFKLLGRMHVLNRLVDDDEILNCCNGINGDLCHSKMTLCLFPADNLNRLENFHEICERHNDIQGVLDGIIFNPTAAVFLNLLMFNIVR
jgi:hypothetical protein